MDVLFRSNLVQDEHWTSRWQEFIKERGKISICPDENGQFQSEDGKDVQLDDTDYHTVFIIELKMPGNIDRWVQISERNFPEGGDEWDALEYVKLMTGAIDGQIVCFTIDGYDGVTEIVK